MKAHPQPQSGLTLVELSVTMGLVGVLGLIIYSLLNMGTILGAKNTAINTAHQQARVAMVDMIQDLHSAISLPQLVDANGNSTPTPTPGTTPGPAAGIAFQKWSMGPLKIIEDVPGPSPSPGQKYIMVELASSGVAKPKVGQRLIVPTHQIEADITAVSGPWDDLKITFANAVPVAISGTDSTIGDVICFITDRCSYTVQNNQLNWTWQGVSRVVANDVTNPTPFNTPSTPAGALYYRFVAAIDLSTSDVNYTNRGFKSANILLNGQVPFKTRLTTYQ